MSRIFATCLTLVLTTVLAAADTQEATPEEAAWFAGTWNATKGIAQDGETLIAGEPKRVVIRHLDGARIERDLPAGDGVTTTAYTVMSFGGRFPWWTDDLNGNLVSRRAGDDTFHLAQVGAMGKADWANGWTYVRVAAATQD